VQTLPTIYQCNSKDELKTQVINVHKALAEFYKNLPDEIFESPAIPDGWSVKRNMKHVISTNNLFSILIGLPRFLFKLLGKPKSDQPTVEKLDPTNRHGITNYGNYTKSTSRHIQRKEKLLQAIIVSAEKINKAIDKRTEEDLDKLPGPWGGMSLRTFILFTLKHNVHHTNVVRLRIEN
jgi:uncharacterized damage-inducible protein DinB